MTIAYIIMGVEVKEQIMVEGEKENTETKHTINSAFIRPLFETGLF